MGKHREGFTLVEMIVAIASASMVTLAAMTIMLAGMRMESKASADAVGQNNTRLFASVLDDVEGIAFEATDAEGNVSLKLFSENSEWRFPSAETDQNETVEGEHADPNEQADPSPTKFTLVSAQNKPLLHFTSVEDVETDKGSGVFTLPTGTVLLENVTLCTVTKDDSLLKIIATTGEGNTYNFAVHFHAVPPTE